MTTYRILIIEDQHEVRHMLASGLRMLGPQFDIIEVPSAEEGFLLALRGSVNLLVTDIRLPGISGLELLEKIQIRNPDLKVILITGVEDSEIRRRVAEANVDAYFYKPIHVDEFIRTVLNCLGIEEEGEVPAPQGEEEQLLVSEQEMHTLPGSPGSLTERLHTLRSELDAQAAFILDREGRVLAQVGEYPQLFSAPSALSYLITVWDAGAKFSHSLEMGLPDNWMSFCDADYRLSLAHASQRYILVLVERDHQALGHWTEVMRAAQADLAQILDAFPVPDAESHASELDGLREGNVDADMVDTASLLRRLESASIEEQDVDAFWDRAVDGDDASGADSGGALSYDQARKMGLAPD